MFIWAAISLGFFGSFHCIGMCGPIALALPIYKQGYFYRTATILLYNLGRILTYSLLGVVFGIIGQGFALAGLQQILSITLGILVLLSVIIPKQWAAKYSLTGSLFGFYNSVKNQLSKFLTKKKLSSLFILGTLNGLLPCGLVYMALAGAASSNNINNAVLFMALFGLATVPLMFSISYISSLATISFRSQMRKATPYVTVVMALFLIVRGLNLNVPYLSPSIDTKTNTLAACHQQKNNSNHTKLCIGRNLPTKK